MGNIITVTISGGVAPGKVRPLYQYDYGQVLKLEGIELPPAYEVHFSNENHGASVTMLGDASGVPIPDACLLSGKPLYAWLFLHTGTEDGETEIQILIPVIARAQPTNETPAPVQQDIITQAVAALSAAVLQTGADVESAGASADAAEESARQAANSAARAQASETAAEAAQNSAERARDAADASAQTSRENAAAAVSSAQSAEISADRAEQAAHTAGYMFVYMDENGHLIYERTGAVDVDFLLSDGHLMMEGV